jgi:hypothetical protein
MGNHGVVAFVNAVYVITGLHFDAARAQTTATGFSSVPTPIS